MLLCRCKHMALDPETGLDPPGIKLRAAEGLEAADFFMPGTSTGTTIPMRGT